MPIDETKENLWRKWLWKDNIGKRVEAAKVLRKVANGIMVELEGGVFAKVPEYELACSQKIDSLSKEITIDKMEV